jgi:hypothetical protein
MTDNIREYQSIKLFRDRKRNNAELLRLAYAGLDFEYRRLLILENELDLHVYFSRMTVLNWLSWSFLALSVSCFQDTIITIAFLVLALLLKIFSWVNRKRFEFVFRSYNLVLSIVDMVILNERTISFHNF